MCNGNCDCCTRPNWALLDGMLFFGVTYGVGSFLSWLESLIPFVWLRWLLLPFALAIFVGALVGAYQISIYKQCGGDYDNA
jgi:hypothetical protein